MRYKALALQVACDAVNQCTSRAAAMAQMLGSCSAIARQIRASKAFIAQDTRLVVLPEYFLSGFPMGESIAEWQDKACLEAGDAVYQALGEIAISNQIYLSGNAYELDPHFPGLYFQSSFVLGPDGTVILRYRRLNSMFAPTPHDVWDEYLRVYGLEAVFPVVDTEIGRLACIASEEILYPEIARCLMMRGAEVFLHSSSEAGSPLQTPKNVAKLARSIENMAYTVSANSAGIRGIDIPMASTDGSSKIVHFEGHILAEAGPGESMVAHATLDLEALRAARLRPGMSNFIARQRYELYAASYASHQAYPANTLAGAAPATRAHFAQTLRDTIEKLWQSPRE